MISTKKKKKVKKKIKNKKVQIETEKDLVSHGRLINYSHG